MKPRKPKKRLLLKQRKNNIFTAMYRREGLFKRSRSRLVVGAVVLLVISSSLLYLIITGKFRHTSTALADVSSDIAASSTVTLIPRRLDGVFVPSGQETLPVIAVMVENHVDSRPLSGLSKANVVFEAPVEGGITRFLALFDATSSVSEIGPVRSARPYFVEWAQSFHGAYFHVGGSPDALDAIKSAGSRLIDVNEMHEGRFFWRSSERPMPHNTYTSQGLIAQTLAEKMSTSSPLVPPIVWHFQDMASTTKRGSVATIRIPYGGVYNVSWKFDAERGVYQRLQSGSLQSDRDGSAVESENVIVIKTDAQVLDSVGRLKLRTTGSGDAIVYRDGNKYPLRWSRMGNEGIKFESTDGTDFILNRGRVWIEVTTDDRIFAGLDLKK